MLPLFTFVNSVFSFFLPEYSPANTRNAELVAPEAMVLQSHRVIGLIDAFYSTIKRGISTHTCYPYTFDGMLFWFIDSLALCIFGSLSFAFFHLFMSLSTRKGQVGMNVAVIRTASKESAPRRRAIRAYQLPKQHIGLHPRHLHRIS